MPTSFARDLALLPSLPSPSPGETRAFIDRHTRALRGAGVGWADAAIIQTAESAGALVYSSDRGVRLVWRRLGHRLP
jgi:hypothetical protein